jgi:hypothetical protein
MVFSQVKALKTFCEGLFSEPCYREVIAGLEDEDHDQIDVNNVLFIRSDKIDAIQQERMEDDLYLLGCFNARFIADNSILEYATVKTMQESECYEALGKLLLNLGCVPAMQEDYASLNGYGHDFNGYDGEQEEITINGIDYLVFDNH